MHQLLIKKYDQDLKDTMKKGQNYLFYGRPHNKNTIRNMKETKTKQKFYDNY